MAPLDTLRLVETPEGVELGLRVAGPLPRMWALAIDVAIRWSCYLFLFGVIGATGGLALGITLLLVFLAEWFYPVLFEVLADGATPGKRALGLRVVHADGTPVGWPASILRSLVSFADFLPFGYVGGFLAAVASPHGQRLGDRAADTVVVYAEPRATPLPGTGAAPQAPAYPLRDEEQEALLEFAERVPRWTPERVRELAELVPALTGDRGDAAVARLQGIAAWVAGAR